MKIVIDASMALAWLFERAKKKEIACAEQALTALADAEKRIVPTLWHTEIANALLVAERRKIVSEAQVIDYLNRLSKLSIENDNTPLETRRDSIMALAREYKLTAYDATYLDLALRIGGVLATFDSALVHAMRHAGGSVFDISIG
ncbi:MAG: PilT protein domain protein [Gammaproteobacteria bacterium]|jgi:predicted nucleic acid-binding protein|nr:PilT protein domain protein [Gammaproteobacteria bacterium]